MLTPVLEKLLILQDRDIRRRGLEAQLRSIPQEVALVERKIASERAAIDAAKNELKELETKKKLLETLTPEALSVDVRPRLTTLKVIEPAKRKGGGRVADVKELVAKLRNEAKVLP